MSGEKVIFTPNSDIEKLTPKSKFQLVGYVDAIEATAKYGQKTAFKFVVNNGNGYRVQVYAWNDQVKRTEAVVKLDHIFYIDGGIGVANSEYNRGNYFGAQLSIQKYTTITDFGKLDRKLYSVSETNDNGELQTIELDAISNNLLPKKFRKYCRVYIKTKFTVLDSGNDDNQAFFYITNGTVRMSVTINLYEANNYNVGDHVILSGSVHKLKSDEECFIVESMNDIEIAGEDKKSINWLLQGNKIIYQENPFNSHKRQKIF
ncbi:Protein of unknown function [Cotesia congregata]|uniref:Uncharacterized protein n=2 Tax=Cotesia congregata TaxID=51543 RepID=A0A8J2MU41_COTCN|nr:Protein of unknown function [Cotesia congregata]